MTIKIIFKLTSVLFMVFLLKSCSIYRPTDAREFPPEPEKRIKKNVEEGRGLKFFKNEKKNNGNFDFATSNEMWRATLDTLDFMPLLAVDYGGGLIITDWYNDTKDINQSIKISIRFLTNEIRSDALNIKIFKKNCNANTNCSITENVSSLNNDLKIAILKKASIYYKDKNKDKNKRSTDQLTILER